MFAAFGAPIKEGFQSNSCNKSHDYDVSACVSGDPGSFLLNNEFLPDNKCVTKVNDSYFSTEDLCGVGTSQVEEEDTDSDDEEDPEIRQSNEQEERELENEKNQKSAASNNNDTESETEDEDTEDESNNQDNEDIEDTQDNEEENEDDNNVDAESDEESDNESQTTTTTGVNVETFYGNNIEHFANSNTNSNVFSSNALLKALMMACLFYVLAHPDTKKHLLKTVFKAINEKYYLYVAMVIFFVLYFVINVFL